MNFYVMCLEFGGLLLVVRGLLFILVRAITTVLRGSSYRFKQTQNFQLIFIRYSTKGIIYFILQARLQHCIPKSLNAAVKVKFILHRPLCSVHQSRHPPSHHFTNQTPTTEALMRNATHRKKYKTFSQTHHQTKQPPPQPTRPRTQPQTLFRHQEKKKEEVTCRYKARQHIDQTVKPPTTTSIVLKR